MCTKLIVSHVKHDLVFFLILNLKLHVRKDLPCVTGAELVIRMKIDAMVMLIAAITVMRRIVVGVHRISILLCSTITNRMKCIS